MADYIATNRANWDDRVPIHVASKFYDVDHWLQERPRPREWELEVLGDVSDLDVVHLQCLSVSRLWRSRMLARG